MEYNHTTNTWTRLGWGVHKPKHRSIPFLAWVLESHFVTIITMLEEMVQGRSDDPLAANLPAHLLAAAVGDCGQFPRRIRWWWGR